jgi:uncharacterized protein with von Willebrand factor type A (vWA) domain
MIANDPYLQQFVNKFTEANQGKVYTGLKGLGEMILRIMKRIVKKKLNKVIMHVGFYWFSL